MKTTFLTHKEFLEKRGLELQRQIELESIKLENQKEKVNKLLIEKEEITKQLGLEVWHKYE